jgi:hypothetical protein
MLEIIYPLIQEVEEHNQHQASFQVLDEQSF